jgi:hypothetical protein
MMFSITPPVSASPSRRTSSAPFPARRHVRDGGVRVGAAHPVLMPSCSVRESEARAPWMKPAMPPLPPVMPPESPRSAGSARDQRLDAGGAARRRDGREDVAVETVCTRALCTSTMGDRR